MMKKLFLALVAILVLMCSSAYAEEVWAYGQKASFFGGKPKIDYYVVTDRLNYYDGQYQLFLREYHNDKVYTIHKYSFEAKNDVLVYFIKKANEWEYQGRVSKNPMAQKIWQTVKPYFEKQGHYVGNWE